MARTIIKERPFDPIPDGAISPPTPNAGVA
jgi:hypothetical protein